MWTTIRSGPGWRQYTWNTALILSIIALAIQIAIFFSPGWREVWIPFTVVDTLVAGLGFVLRPCVAVDANSGEIRRTMFSLGIGKTRMVPFAQVTEIRFVRRSVYIGKSGSTILYEAHALLEGHDEGRAPWDKLVRIFSLGSEATGRREATAVAELIAKPFDDVALLQS